MSPGTKVVLTTAIARFPEGTPGTVVGGSPLGHLVQLDNGTPLCVRATEIREVAQ